MTEPMEEQDEQEPHGLLGEVELAPGLYVSADALRFSFSRSSGPGGQNVNKRSTKAELRLNVSEIPLSVSVFARFMKLSASWRVDGGEELLIQCDEHRSQLRNRSTCLERLRKLLLEAQVLPKPRRPTRPTKGSIERRLAEKKTRGALLKQRRQSSED